MWQERMKNRCSINQSLHIAVLLSLKSFFVSPAEAQLLEQENERLLEQLSSLTNAVDQVGSTPPPGPRHCRALFMPYGVIEYD